MTLHAAAAELSQCKPRPLAAAGEPFSDEGTLAPPDVAVLLFLVGKSKHLASWGSNTRNGAPATPSRAHQGGERAHATPLDRFHPLGALGTIYFYGVPGTKYRCVPWCVPCVLERI